jgi:hypothetical protein
MDSFLLGFGTGALILGGLFCTVKSWAGARVMFGLAALAFLGSLFVR